MRIQPHKTRYSTLYTAQSNQWEYRESKSYIYFQPTQARSSLYILVPILHLLLPFNTYFLLSLPNFSIFSFSLVFPSGLDLRRFATYCVYIFNIIYIHISLPSDSNPIYNLFQAYIYINMKYLEVPFFYFLLRNLSFLAIWICQGT